MIAAARLDEDTDEELIRRFQQSGDTAAFESLVHRYDRDLFVDYVVVDGRTIQAEGGAAVVDRGTGDAAFDGIRF